MPPRGRGREVEVARLNYLTEQRELDSIDEALWISGTRGQRCVFALPTSYPCSSLDNHGSGMVFACSSRPFIDHRALFSLRFHILSSVYPLNDGGDQSCLEVDDAFARRCQALERKKMTIFDYHLIHNLDSLSCITFDRSSTKR